MSSLPRDRRATLALLCVAQLMVILDISAVNVALPDLARDLGIAREHLEWTITSYTLLFGSLLLLGGRAADLLGRRRTFLAGLGVFVAASLAAALAPDAGTLFAARAGQGLGAALLSPAALSIVVTSFDGPERARALAVWGGIGAAGGAIGVLLGGVLTEWLGWRAIFLVNVPVGALLAAGVLRRVAADGAAPRLRGLDLRGALTGTVSLALALYAIADADDAGWTGASTLVLAGAAALGLALFAALERGAARPLLRVERLGERAVGGGWALNLAASAVMMASFLLVSIYLQDVLGASPLEAGLAFLPLVVAIGIGAHIGSHAVQHAGVRAPAAAAFALGAVGALLLSGVDAAGSYATGVLPGMLVLSVALGIAMVLVSITVLAGASHEDAGMLSGLNTTGHELGGSLGVAALTSIAAGSMDAFSGRAGVAEGVGDAFLAAGGIAAVAAVAALAILPAAGTFLARLRQSPHPVSMH